MIIGNSATGVTTAPLVASRLYLFDFPELAHDLTIGALIASLNGLGSGDGAQVLRPACAESDDVRGTLRVGPEFVVEEGVPLAWLHLPFDVPPRLRSGHVPALGLLAGPSSSSSRLGGTSAANTAEIWTVPYVGEGAPVLPANPSTPAYAFVPALCALGVKPWAPPEGTTDQEVARLPLHVAGALFDGAAADVGFPAVCGWHYLLDAPPRPATCIARTDGPLAEYVGERVRVSVRTGGVTRSVVVFVDDEQPFEDELADEDLSLARSAFLELAPLWTEALDVTVEVIA